MDTFSTMLADYDSRANKARGMGGTAKLEARRATGILNARERLECLLDGDSFTESGLFAVSHRPEMRDKSPADGKIGGFGTVSGRPVAIVSNDFTVLGASSSQVNGRKIQHIKQVATKAGMPLIFLGESAGARMPDRMGAAGRAMLGQDPEEYQRIRKTPWVSAVLGPCFGSATWYSCMSDFVVMRKGGLLAVASSRVTSVAINQKIDPEELGGWKMHAATTGLVDRVVDTDEEALATIRTFLGYLPSHSGEAPPKGDCGAPAGAEGRTILDILPESRHRTYDMRKLVAVIADADSVFPLKERFGRSIVTALARLGGRSVGIIANNPMFKGGAIDVDACRKATSFMVLCDSFNLPLVFLTDQPGFLIGVEGEVRGAPGLIMNWMNALSLVTVPKIAIVLRKSYGQAYLNMGGGRNSDEMALWPTADLGFMDPAVAVNILHGLERADDPQRFDTLAAEIARDSSAWELAAGYHAQSVIHPAETRDYIRQVLDIHEDRMSGGVGKHRLANWPTSY